MRCVINGVGDLPDGDGVWIGAVFFRLQEFAASTNERQTWNKPLALPYPLWKAARPLVETIPAEAFSTAETFWPGPLTLVLRASSWVAGTGGLATIGVRVPKHRFHWPSSSFGVPMATTSVNRWVKARDLRTTAAKHVGNQVDG